MLLECRLRRDSNEVLITVSGRKWAKNGIEYVNSFCVHKMLQKVFSLRSQVQDRKLKHLEYVDL